MIEKFLSLFERLVVGVEALAKTASVPAASPSQPDAPPADGPKPARSRKQKEESATPPAAPATDDDFLGGGASTPPAKVYTRDEVKAVLSKLVGKVGQSSAFALFKSVGGVDSLNDLAEDKFGTVVKAAEAELAK